MVKEPRPGRVKTRLGRDIGMTKAAWWFRHQSGTLIRNIAHDPRWTTVLAVAPDIEGLLSRVWPSEIQRVPQGSGNLSQRMGRILHGLSAGPVAIIGADIPGITRSDIAGAFRTLNNHDAVFGPSPDGGYWLVGMRRTRKPARNLFDGVKWSSEHALADSMACMRGLEIAQIRMLADVDTVTDLNKLNDRNRV